MCPNCERPFEKCNCFKQEVVDVTFKQHLILNIRTDEAAR